MSLLAEIDDAGLTPDRLARERLIAIAGTALVCEARAHAGAEVNAEPAAEQWAGDKA